ncbi:MAG: formyltransferase family protein [Balneolaceae bacterium]|nr:formyltransferase family protein [Balneolaceae bacterium]
MGHRGVVITAGFDKSEAATCLVELFKQKGVPVKGIIVVSPYSLRRIRFFLKKKEFSTIVESIRRLAGFQRSISNDRSKIIKQFRSERQISIQSLKKWAKVNQAKIISVNRLNSDQAIHFLKETDPQWLVYSGGGILKEPVINQMDGRILNAHQGPLPEIRGMNAAEWSILLDQKQEATIHLIDRGIDTGKIIKSIPYSIEENDDIESIREKAIIKGIEGLIEVGSKETLEMFNVRENHSEYRQCYTLSYVMKEMLQQKLKAKKKRSSGVQKD